MTEADVVSMETHLGIVLPAHYRKFVLAYPESLHKAKFARDQEPASESFLFDCPRMVIDLNKGIREPGVLVMDGETEPWPEEYLIIGADGGGNYWCIKLGGRSKDVWFFEHEEGVIARVAKSLSEHERYALDFVKEFNRRK